MSISSWIIAASIYKKYAQKMAVVTVCTEVYVCGYINAMDDVSKTRKKPFMRNIANMAVSSGIGLLKAAVFPIYIPATCLYVLLRKK
jgi:hypothetical protein